MEIFGDVVAQLGVCGGSEGDMVTQLLSPLGDTRLKTHQSRVQIRLPPYSLLKGTMKYDCVLQNKSQGVKNNKFFLKKIDD
jgi:hypothetical protein